MHSTLTDTSPDTSPLRTFLTRTFLTAALAVAVTFGLVAPLSATAASAPVTATTNLNVRSRPSLSGTVVGALHRGETVSARADSNGWTTITYQGKTAYVSSRYLTKGSTLPAGSTVGKGTTKTTTTAVNLRKSPSLSAGVITVLAKGTKVVATGTTSKGFTEVTAGSREGWVMSQYLTSAATGLPAVTGTRRATADLLVLSTSDSSATLVAKIKKGSSVSITGATKNGRAQIVYKGAVAWVTARYLSNGAVTSPAAPALPKVVGTRYATAVLTVRSSSADTFTDLGDIPVGTAVSITGVTQNGRAQIVYEQAVRWVTAKYLSTTKPKTTSSTSDTVASPGVEKGLKPNALKVLAAVRKDWPQIRTIGGVHPDPLPDHPSGRALDLMLPGYKSATGKKLGYDLSRWLVAHHTELGINYVIYDQHIWNELRADEGWRYMADRGSDSANHKNHVHVTVLADGYKPI